MEGKYNIKIEPEFMESLLSDTNYIRNEYFDDIAADKLVDTIYGKISRRLNAPESYQTKSIKTDNNKYYIINIKNRMIFYRVKDKTVEVAFMYHAGWNGLDDAEPLRFGQAPDNEGATPNEQHDRHDAEMVDPGNLEDRVQQLEEIMNRYGIKGQVIQIDVEIPASRYYYHARSKNYAKLVKQNNILLVRDIESQILQIFTHDGTSGVFVTADTAKGNINIDLPNIDTTEATK